MKKQNHSKEKNIFTRYVLLFILIFFFQSELFLNSMSTLFTYLSYLFLKLFTNVELINNALYISENNYMFLIVKECIAASAYILISIIFFTIPLNLKKTSKMFLKSIILLSVFNLLRIFFLMWIHVTFGADYYERYHLLFYDALSGIVTALIIIYYLRKEKVKNVYPVITDLNYLIKFYKK